MCVCVCVYVCICMNKLCSVRDAVRDDGGVRVLCQLLSQACQDPQVSRSTVFDMAMAIVMYHFT